MVSGPDELFGGFGAGNITGWISSAIREGMDSATAAQTFRDFGGRIYPADWDRYWGQASAVEAAYPNAANLDPNAIPHGSEYVDWAAGRGGQYATNVWMTIYDPKTDTERVQVLQYMTNDPHTPGEAIAGVMDQINNPASGEPYPVTAVAGIAGPPMSTVAYGPA